MISAEDVDFLTELVYKIEATEGILSDWSLPGAHTESAAYEITRTVCRRAERNAVRLMEAGVEVKPEILAYLIRLSDLLWLFGRRIEHTAGCRRSPARRLQSRSEVVASLVTRKLPEHDPSPPARSRSAVLGTASHEGQVTHHHRPVSHLRSSRCPRRSLNRLQRKSHLPTETRRPK